MEVSRVDNPEHESLRKVAFFDYCLHIASPILSMGVLTLIALIINYVKRDDARGTIYESHMNWMIRTTWWTLFWLVVLAVPWAILSLITLGLFSFLIVLPVIWYLYRMIKGLLRLNDEKPMPE